MKFGQLIEYNMKNIFLEKSYTKYGGETVHRPFSKKWKLSISLDIAKSLMQFVSSCMSSWGLSEYIVTKLHTTYFHLV